MVTKTVQIQLKAHIECADCGLEEVLPEAEIDFHNDNEFQCERCYSNKKPLLQGIYQYVVEEE